MALAVAEAEGFADEMADGALADCPTVIRAAFIAAGRVQPLTPPDVWPQMRPVA